MIYSKTILNFSFVDPPVSLCESRRLAYFLKICPANGVVISQTIGAPIQPLPPLDLKNFLSTFFQAWGWLPKKPHDLAPDYRSGPGADKSAPKIYRQPFGELVFIAFLSTNFGEIVPTIDNPSPSPLSRATLLQCESAQL